MAGRQPAAGRQKHGRVSVQVVRWQATKAVASTLQTFGAGYKKMENSEESKRATERMAPARIGMALGVERGPAWPSEGVPGWPSVVGAPQDNK